MKNYLFILILLASCSSSKKKVTASELTNQIPEMSASDVRTTIGTNLHNFRSCYEREGKNERQFVKLSFLVDKKGNVFDSSVESNTQTKDLENCIKTILDGLTFPSPRVNKAIAKQNLTFVPPLL